MTCRYFHSTIADRKMRPAGSYDFSAVTQAGLKKHMRRSGRYNHTAYYRVAFYSGDDSFEMPKDFHFRDDALEEIAKINNFLHSNRPAYRYEKRTSTAAEKDFLIIILSMPVLILAAIIAVLMICEWIKSVKKYKRRDQRWP